MQLRPWESLASLAWLKCVTVHFPFHSSIILISNLLFTVVGGVDDERLDGPLPSLKEIS